MKPDKLLAEWFWTDRWMGSSGFLLPLEPRGLYREMLTQAWRRGARLPNDHEAIMRATGTSPKEWARCWPKVSAYWRVDGEWLVNDTQLEVFGEALAGKDRASVRAKAAADARWSIAQAMLEHAAVDAQALLEHCPPSPSPSPTPNGTETARAVRPKRAKAIRTTIALPAPEKGLAAPMDEPVAEPPEATPWTDEERRGYTSAIWGAFASKANLPATREMSSTEWSLMKRWMDEGVPLRIVLRGIEDTKGQGARLQYYGPSVEDAATQWRKAVGR